MFDRTPMFETSVPISVFGVDRTTSGARRVHAARRRGRARTVRRRPAAFAVAAPHGLEAVSGAGVVVVPGWRDAQEAPPERRTRTRCAPHTPTARSSSVCAWARSCSGPRACSTGGAPRPTGCTRRTLRGPLPRGDRRLVGDLRRRRRCRHERGYRGGHRRVLAHRAAQVGRRGRDGNRAPHGRAAATRRRPGAVHRAAAPRPPRRRRAPRPR